MAAPGLRSGEQLVADENNRKKLSEEVSEMQQIKSLTQDLALQDHLNSGPRRRRHTPLNSPLSALIPSHERGRLVLDPRTVPSVGRHAGEGEGKEGACVLLFVSDFGLIF